MWLLAGGGGVHRRSAVMNQVCESVYGDSALCMAPVKWVPSGLTLHPSPFLSEEQESIKYFIIPYLQIDEPSTF
jgi:hypothetical protein